VRPAGEMRVGRNFTVFEIYISSDQILPVKKIDESSEEIKSFIKAVKSYTGEVTEKEDSAEDAFSELKKDYIIEKRYRITDTLFKGRDYCVFLTLHEKTGRSCAVKAMSKPEDQAEAKRELTREIAFLNKLSHPNLSSVVDIIDTKEYLFAVMNFNEGMTLSEVVEAEGAQNEETVVRWAREICSALEYLHSLEPAAKANGITLSNILRDSSGKTSLMSYGIGGGASYGENTSYYLAPEISVGKADDGRGDIYSVGAVMYSLITGNDPDEEPHAVYPIRRANADVSEAFENIVAKCMDPDPNKRYGSISQLSKALEGLEKGKMTFKEKLAKLFKK